MCACVRVCVGMCVCGGGGGRIALATLIFLCQEPLFCLVSFNHDKTKFRTKLTCLPSNEFSHK